MEETDLKTTNWIVPANRFPLPK